MYLFLYFYIVRLGLSDVFVCLKNLLNDDSAFICGSVIKC